MKIKHLNLANKGDLLLKLNILWLFLKKLSFIIFQQ